MDKNTFGDSRCYESLAKTLSNVCNSKLNRKVSKFICEYHTILKSLRENTCEAYLSDLVRNDYLKRTDGFPLFIRSILQTCLVSSYRKREYGLRTKIG